MCWWPVDTHIPHALHSPRSFTLGNSLHFWVSKSASVKWRSLLYHLFSRVCTKWSEVWKVLGTVPAKKNHTQSILCKGKGHFQNTRAREVSPWSLKELQNVGQIKVIIKRQKWKGAPGGSVVKNPPANEGDTGSIPALGRSHMPWSQLSLYPTTTEPVL